VLDLNAVVSSMDKMLQRVIGEDVELVTQLSQDLGSVSADPGQLEQVLLNLACERARREPRGGRLIIETATSCSPRSTPCATHRLPPGSYVLLAVSDTGVCMDETTQAHLFEPFFTTKEVGKGRVSGSPL